MAYRINNNDKPTPVSKTTAYSQERQNNQYEHTAPLPEFQEEEPRRTSGGKRFAQVLFTLVLLALTGVSFGLSMLPKLDSIELPDEIGIIKKEEINLTEEEVEEYVKKSDEVVNILLIGLDGEGYEEGRSDVMMIATINKATKEIHLTSIQRDTMVYLPSRGTYEKLNHSYSYDGAIGTMQAINQNYDMDIKEFVVFDFNALKLLVDAVGGVVVNIDENEAYDMTVSGQPAPGLGDQLLNGEQALIYARVRYTSGGDAGRNERQREILKYIFQQSKDLSLGQMKDLALNVLPAIKTSYTYGSLISMIEYYDTIKSGATLVEHGFPFEKTDIMYDELSYIIPLTVESNITELHKIIFDFDNYRPSNRALEYSEYIGSITGLY